MSNIAFGSAAIAAAAASYVLLKQLLTSSKDDVSPDNNINRSQIDACSISKPNLNSSHEESDSQPNANISAPKIPNIIPAQMEMDAFKLDLNPARIDTIFDNVLCKMDAYSKPKIKPAAKIDASDACSKPRTNPASAARIEKLLDFLIEDYFEPQTQLIRKSTLPLKRFRGDHLTAHQHWYMTPSRYPTDLQKPELLLW